jgi:hypothetical protein
VTTYPGSIGFVDQAPGPMAHAWDVVKSDTVPLPATTRAIYVGATGDVTVQMAGVLGATDGSNPTLFAAVPAGTTLNIACTFVMSTGTSSTNVVALW